MPTALSRVGRRIFSTPTPSSGLKEFGVGGGYGRKSKAHTIPRKSRACGAGLTSHPDMEVLRQPLVPATQSSRMSTKQPVPTAQPCQRTAPSWWFSQQVTTGPPALCPLNLCSTQSVSMFLHPEATLQRLCSFRSPQGVHVPQTAAGCLWEAPFDQGQDSSYNRYCLQPVDTTPPVLGSHQIKPLPEKEGHKMLVNSPGSGEKMSQDDRAESYWGVCY